MPSAHRKTVEITAKRCAVICLSTKTLESGGQRGHRALLPC